MSKKVINRTLLWQAIVWAQYKHAHLPASEQIVRPQRPYLPGDGKALSPLISAVRAAYYTDRCTHGKKAQFEACKKTVMDTCQTKYGWSNDTRNFYSSVVSTYITWDAGTQSVATKRVLALLTPVLSYLQTTPERTT